MKGSGSVLQNVGLCEQRFFFCSICSAVGERFQYICIYICLAPWKYLSCLIYWQFLACKLSTFNTLGTSAMKTLIIHEIFFFSLSIFISSAVGIFNNTNRDSSLVATVFREGHDSFNRRVHSSSVSFSNKIELKASRRPGGELLQKQT